MSSLSFVLFHFLPKNHLVKKVRLKVSSCYQARFVIVLIAPHRLEFGFNFANYIVDHVSIVCSHLYNLLEEILGCVVLFCEATKPMSVSFSW